MEKVINKGLRAIIEETQAKLDQISLSDEKYGL